MKVKRWNKIYHENICRRKTRITPLVSDKVDVRTETVTKDREEYYIIISSIRHEDIAIVVPNRAVKHVKET